MFKDRKSVRNSPILRNCTYIIVPVIAIVAFKFIGSGVNWMIGVFSKVGWSILITFVLTSLFWACFYGLKEQRKLKVKESVSLADDADDEEGVLDVRNIRGFRCVKVGKNKTSVGYAADDDEDYEDY